MNKEILFDYVIFHRNCLDGFSSFIVLTLTDTIDDNATIYPDVPSAKEPPPGLQNKNVIIMDVAYKKEVLEQIFNEAAYVLFIDHHITIADDVRQLVGRDSKHEVVYDNTKSGASLTWSYFFPDKRPPWYIKYIEDNDIGVWQYKLTEFFILGLQVNYTFDLSKENIKKWRQLFDKRNLYRLIKLGKKYAEYEDYLLHLNSKKYSLELFPSQIIFDDYPGVFDKPGQYRVAVVNGGCPSVSLLGKKIVNELPCDFCILWTLHLDKKELVISFRSKDVDVGRIAKAFGGGGHNLASSAGIPLGKYNITDLFYPESLPRFKR